MPLSLLDVPLSGEVCAAPRHSELCASLFGQRERGRLQLCLNPHRRRDLQVISPLALTLSLCYQIANVDRRSTRRNPNANQPIAIRILSTNPYRHLYYLVLHLRPTIQY